MRFLANNISDDKKIISGESGAVTSGIFYSLMTDDSLKDYREKIGLDKDSVILFFPQKETLIKNLIKKLFVEENKLNLYFYFV